MKKINRSQALIISELVTLLIEQGKYHSIEEARREFQTFFFFPAREIQDSLLGEGGREYKVSDLTFDQAEFVIDLYRNLSNYRMISAPSAVTSEHNLSSAAPP